LKGLPKNKIHCSLLAEEGLKKAIEDYEKKSLNKQVKKQ
ncbi:iron-sulfur cluster assembly scaffold protein, partial [Candidatus Woesearchaeota archaeon]|nr:iron-sulfur cluster assembly scaffold protein [Candidatus Woesearchaeota archaeon]